MNCEVCSKIFSGEVPYNQHINSEKHKKKVALLGNSNYNYLSSIDNNPVIQSNQNVTVDCSVCNASFDSIHSFQRHAESLEHVTNVSKKHNQNEEVDATTDMPSTARNDSKIDDKLLNLTLSSSDKTDTILPEITDHKVFQLLPLSCELCNKCFSGPESHKQHLESAAHKKKADIQNVQNILSPLSCDICKKMFSGRIPYEQHMSSDAHRKKLQNMQYFEKWKETNSGDKSVLECDSSGDIPSGITDTNRFQAENNPFFCKMCNVPCSGFVPYQQHLMGEMHIKNSRRRQFQENFSSLGYKSGNQKIDASTHINDVHSSASDVGREEIIPQMTENLEVMSFKDLNLKEFLPEDTLDFDDLKINVNEDPVENKNECQNSSMAQCDEVQMGNSVVYEECQYCNVKLQNKSEALAHFESMEHFTRRWHSEKSSFSRKD